MQPDTQREGPAYRLGQGTTQDQPRGEGKQKQAGGEPTNAKQTRHKQKGPTTQGSTTQREKHQKAQKQKPHTDTSRTQKGRARKGTRQRNKDEGRKRQHDQVEAAPEKQKAKRGAARAGTPPAKVRKGPHTTIANGSKLYCGAQGRRAR